MKEQKKRTAPDTTKQVSTRDATVQRVLNPRVPRCEPIQKMPSCRPLLTYRNATHVAFL